MRKHRANSLVLFLFSTPEGNPPIKPLKRQVAVVVNRNERGSAFNIAIHLKNVFVCNTIYM